MTDIYSAAPQPSHRLIPSKFPPIGLFDTVTTAADLAAVMDLAGWTNDRLVAERIDRLPEDEWVYGVPNASVVMASFLHVLPDGARFNGSELGAWYAAGDIRAAAAEVAHHLRREAAARGATKMIRVYRTYTSGLRGDYLDICGQEAIRPDLYLGTSYDVSQKFGEDIRASGGAGILYDSLRWRGGVNMVAYRPRNIVNVKQADHFEITVSSISRAIEIRKLPGSP